MFLHPGMQSVSKGSQLTFCKSDWLFMVLDFRGFTISLLSPRAPLKALLSVDRCQIIVAKGENMCEKHLIAILLMLHHSSHLELLTSITVRKKKFQSLKSNLFNGTLL